MIEKLPDGVHRLSDESRDNEAHCRTHCGTNGALYETRVLTRHRYREPEDRE